ncbi:hypothetical protein FSPOR_2263 [Fusarium sporotrichioides]|uniref:Uncharacterized protein n=1 Tax=Fusarium sporotrichioides TaxID=5514 RepID=A0A395SLI6_FUSSP|nr:hypothetical protein FSPOR_2263 [Fusarium sporotrichioides]
MLTSAEKEAIDQEVATIFEGYSFATPTNEGFKSDDTSHGQTTGTTNEASARLNQYATLSPELASHARKLERYRFLCKYSPWNQAKSRFCSLQVTSGKLPTVVAPPQEPSTKRGRDEDSCDQQATTDHS